MVRKRTFSPVVVGVVLAGSIGIFGQSASGRAGGQGGSARLIGRVVAADGGTPIKYATVRLAARSASLAVAAQGPASGPRPDSQGPACQTDENGYFEFDDLSPDRYILNVESPGYVRPSPLQGIDLEAGETGAVSVALERPGAISGRVLSDSAGPIAGARVRLLRRDTTSGSGRLVIGTLGPGSLATTDAQGGFTFADLAPGDYYLVAGVFPRPGPTRDAGPHVGYVPTYYPGSSLPAGALPVAVRSGQETRRADFVVRRDKLGTVSGRATDADGRPFPMGSPGQPMRASLVLRSVVDDPALVSTVIRSPDGRFTIPDVPPGDYYLSAAVLTGTSTTPGEGAYVPVAVNGNEAHADIRTNKGASLSGRVVVEGLQADQKPPGRIIVSTRQPVSSAVPSVHAATTVADDRTFRLAPLRGRVLVAAQADQLALKSVMIGGQEMMGKPIELRGTEQVTDAVIVMTGDTARLQGTVTTGAGEPVAATVILFADSPDTFGPQSPGIHVTRAIGVTAPETTASPTPPALPPAGGFAFPRVLPGRYLLVAIDSGTAMPILDRDSFTRWRPLATPVTLAAGQTAKVELKAGK